MSGNVIDSGTLIRCPHGGRAATTAPASSPVRADGLPVGTAALVHTVTGCPHTVDGVPVPCTSIRWTPGSGGGVHVDGSPVLLDTSAALCFTAALVPQGPPVVSAPPRKVICR